MRRSGKRRLAGWRAHCARLALFALVFESLVNVGVAAFAAPAPDAGGGPLGYIEICTPTGVTRIYWDGGAPSEETPDTPAVPDSPRSFCVLCAAPAALPVALPDLVVPVEWPGAASLLPAREPVAELPSRPCRPTLSRAPPLHI